MKRRLSPQSAIRNLQSSIVFMLFLPALLLAQGFSVAHDSSVLALAPESLRTQFKDALVDAGTNWPELARAVEMTQTDYRNEAVWLIVKMPHLDRLEMTSAILLEHITYAHLSATAFKYRVPDSLFRDFILTYRIADEPVAAWRRLLYDRFSPLTRNAATPEQAARIVNQWLSRSIKVFDKGFFGPMKAPELTLVSGSGSREEIAVLACAILKTLDVPSRRVKVPWLGEENGDATWVEVISNGEWLPMYPLDAKSFGNARKTELKHPHNVTIAVATSAFDQALVTDQYTATGRLYLHLTSAGIPLARFENFSVNAFNYGAWRALDELNTVTDSLGNYECVLGDGNYLVTCGMRDPQGNPWILNRWLEVKPGDSINLDLDLTPPVTRTEHPVCDDPLLQHDFPNLVGGISSPSSLKGRTGLVVFFDPEDSLATRTLVSAESLYGSFKDKGLAVMGIGFGNPDAVRAVRDRNRLSFDIAFASDSRLATGHTAISDLLDLLDAVPMPMLKLVSKDAKVIATEPAPDETRLAALRKTVADLLK